MIKGFIENTINPFLCFFDGFMVVVFGKGWTNPIDIVRLQKIQYNIKCFLLKKVSKNTCLFE